MESRVCMGQNIIPNRMVWGGTKKVKIEGLEGSESAMRIYAKEKYR